MNTYSSIRELFPHDEFRPGQKKTSKKVHKAFEDGKRYCILEGACGSGKSAIGYTIARHFDRAYWICPQKILQDQIARDYGQDGQLIHLKGRNAYPCNYWETVAGFSEADQEKILAKARKQPNARWVAAPSLRCNEGVCRLRDKKSSCQECRPASPTSHCAYYSRLRQAQSAPICLMNFSNFILHLLTDGFGERDLLIIDEVHGIEGELLDFITISFEDRDFNFKFPKYETAQEYLEFFQKKNMRGLIQAKIQTAKMQNKTREEDHWKNVLMKFEIFEQDLGDNGVWTCETKDKNVMTIVEFKPVHVQRFASKYVLNHAKHVLMMSATILRPQTLIDALGLDPEQTLSHRMNNRFPIENRPIHFQPAGSLSYKHKRDTYPQIVRDIDKLCEKYAGQRGIIHTHNFEISDMLLEECEYSGRFLYQKNFESKDEMLKKHAESEDTVIVAPAMHEGLDLKGELATWQVVVKVPYPNFHDNPQLRVRMDLDREYYPWLTALKLVQSVGRAVRSETDRADTYILDSEFKNFYKRSSHLIPKWFKEAVIW